MKDLPQQRRETSTYWLRWNKVPIALGDGKTLVGREPGVDVWLDVPSVSRHHARIIIHDGQASVQDLGSKNGTWVHGQLATAPVSLVNGDEIRIGTVVVTFRSWSPDVITKTQSQSDLRPATGSARRASSPRR